MKYGSEIGIEICIRNDLFMKRDLLFHKLSEFQSLGNIYYFISQMKFEKLAHFKNFHTTSFLRSWKCRLCLGTFQWFKFSIGSAYYENWKRVYLFIQFLLKKMMKENIILFDLRNLRFKWMYIVNFVFLQFRSWLD